MILLLALIISLFISLLSLIFTNKKLKKVKGSLESPLYPANQSMDNFPFLNKIITIDELKLRARRLPEVLDKIITISNEKYTPITAVNKCILGNKLNGEYLRFLSEWSDTEDYDELALFFSEKQLAKCYTAKTRPLEISFAKLGKKLATDLRKTKPDYTQQEFRNYIFKNIKFCHNFRTSLAAKIYKHFNAKSVIDFSSGWGDRLFAACAMNIKYLGMDPNISLQQPYAEIAKTLDSNNLVIPSGAEYLPNTRLLSEMAKLDIEMFDMLFTSPPYYDYEIYSTGPQSIDLFGHSYEKWLVFFLFYVIGKYAKYVKNHIIIYMQDVDNKVYLEPIIMFVLLTQPFKYCGIFSSNRFPAIVFERADTKLDTKSYRSKFMRYYPEIYKNFVVLENITDDCLEIGAEFDGKILNDSGKNNSIQRAEFRKIVNDDYMQCLLESIKEMFQYFNINISEHGKIGLSCANSQYEECLIKLGAKSVTISSKPEDFGIYVQINC